MIDHLLSLNSQQGDQGRASRFDQLALASFMLQSNSPSNTAYWPDTSRRLRLKALWLMLA